MKIGISILVISLAMLGCQSGRQVTAAQAEFASVPAVDVSVRETVRDTLVVEEKPDVMKQEEATLAQGSELKHYCIIVGSFMYYENAVKLRNSLLRQGFFNSSIMRNREGMYRVCIACDEALPDAQDDLSRIRSQFPQFRDAWLLSVKN